jgi:hypothetical protein
MKWKQAGPGSAGDICKSSILSREAEKMCMQKFLCIHQIYHVGSFADYVYSKLSNCKITKVNEIVV